MLSIFGLTAQNLFCNLESYFRNPKTPVTTLTVVSAEPLLRHSVTMATLSEFNEMLVMSDFDNCL
jgi:hypothetical protein